MPDRAPRSTPGGHDRRFLVLAFAWQIIAVTTAAFLDKGHS